MKNFNRIAIQVDARAVYKVITTENYHKGAHISLLKLIQTKLCKFVNIKVEHVFREANKCVDGLIKIRIWKDKYIDRLEKRHEESG